MAMAGLIGQGVDSAIGGITALFQGIQQNEVAKYNAKTAENEAESQRNLMEYNAKMEDREAQFAVDEARSQETRQRREALRFMGAQRAALGGAGVTQEGSPLEVFGETAANLEMQALDIRRQGEAVRWEHLARAVNYRYQGDALYNAGMQEGKIQRYTGRMAVLGGVLKFALPIIMDKSNFNMSGQFKGGGSGNGGIQTSGGTSASGLLSGFSNSGGGGGIRSSNSGSVTGYGVGVSNSSYQSSGSGFSIGAGNSMSLLK